MRLFKSLILLGVTFGFVALLQADHHKNPVQDAEVEDLLWPLDVFDGDTGEVVELPQGISPGSVFIIGEQDGVISEQLFEGRFITALAVHSKRRYDSHLSLGFGDIAYNQQIATRQYAEGRISQDDFLSIVHWVPSLPLDLYELHFKMPALVEGQVWALGQPLHQLIAYYGLEGLSEEEKTLLPPFVIKGDSNYKERFFEHIKQRVDPALLSVDDEDMNESLRLNLEKRYTAQLVQDSTVAWNIQQAMQEDPKQVLIVLVEEIAMSYGGGLLQALEEYGVEGDVFTLSQTIAYEGQGVGEVVGPHEQYGVRADYVVVRDDLKRQYVERNYRNRALKLVKSIFDKDLENARRITPQL